MSKFKYTGDVPESFNIPFLENTLIHDGICGAYIKPNGDLIAVPGGYTGEVNDFNISDYFTGATAETSVAGVRIDNEKMTVCWNNDTRTGDTKLLKYHCDILQELNNSIKSLGKFAKYNNVFGVSERKTQIALEKAIDENAKGKPAVFLSENILEDLENANNVETVKLFDISNASYFQYLSKMREDELSIIFFILGLDYGGGVKLAQQTEREISQGGHAKMVYIEQQLKHRKDFCNNLKKMGYDINVELNEQWKEEREEETQGGVDDANTDYTD